MHAINVHCEYSHCLPVGQPLHQLGVLRGPDKADERAALAQQRHFRLIRRAHLEHDVSGAPQRGSVGNDFCASSTIGVVADTGCIPSAGLDLYLKTKLDELPQLWNVLKGEMSLVGPRPNLFNQGELIAERDALSVYAVRPGITGLAQVKEIDMSTPALLAKTDAQMIRELTVVNYFKYILQTVTGKGAGDRVKCD